MKNKVWKYRKLEQRAILARLYTELLELSLLDAAFGTQLLTNRSVEDRLRRQLKAGMVYGWENAALTLGVTTEQIEILEARATHEALKLKDIFNRLGTENKNFGGGCSGCIYRYSSDCINISMGHPGCYSPKNNEEQK